MIAPFWNDLRTSTGEVYKYTTNPEYVIIQWDDLRIEESNNTRETFQIILYNSEYSEYETVTGDSEIKIQYKEFNNPSNGNINDWVPTHAAYCTVGIENHFADMGLEYTFNNSYPTAAMPLSDNTALFITTGKRNDYLLGDLNQDEIINVLDVVQLVGLILSPSDATSYQLIVGDVNSDGFSNILDVVIIVGMILG